MMPFLYRYKRKVVNKKGMTVVETVITLAITTILLTLIVAGIMRIVNQAYMTRANETAEVIYMAAQSAITDMKADGTFDKTFSEEKRTEGQFHTVPENALTGGKTGGVGYPGVAISNDEEGRKTEDYLNQLIEDEDLVYMKLSMEDSGEDSKLLRKILEPYIGDKSILDYSILVEINLNNKTVRSAFYTERAEELVYSEGALDENQLLNKKNVLLRDRHPSLFKKRQGFYGSMGVGAPENLGILENAYVKVNNDDMLTVEWGEIGPAANEGGVTEEKRQLFTDMTYDLKIVNAHDTSKVYYFLEGISAYKSDEKKYADTDKTVVYKSGTSGPVRDPMPIYDLYGYSDVNYALDESLMVPVRTTVYNEDGSVKKVYDGATDKFLHRLSYYVPADINNGGTLKKQYGVYRLVLDSITGEDTSLSIKERYPEIPWDEDFKVIVEGKYKEEGFTGSLSLSEGQDNGYVASKSLNPTEDMYVSGLRGANVLQELQNYVNAEREAKRSNMWYQVEYARHLNNMRYIVGYKDDPDAEKMKEGYKQNFLLTGDIDWSLQQLGAKENILPDNTVEVVHRLTVSNAEGKNLTDIKSENLRIFQAISASEESDGYQGKLLSEVQKDEEGNIKYIADRSGEPIKVGVDYYHEEPVPLYHTYALSHLKLANDANDGNQVGIFEQVGQNGYFRDFMVYGATSQGKNRVGAIAGEFKGYAKNLTILRNTTPNYHMKAELNNDIWEEVKISGMVVEPYQYLSSSRFSGNTIEADEDYAGGMFGTVSPGAEGTLPADKLSGVVKDISNGTRLADLYAGKINAADQSQNPALGNAEMTDLNGLLVTADNFAGGLIGHADKKSKITKAVNTGSVLAKNNYAGGIVGTLDEESTINAWDQDSLIDDATAHNGDIITEDEEYLSREYEYSAGGEIKIKKYKAAYTNYGVVTAKHYAGGVAGQVKGTNQANGGSTRIINVANAGPVIAIEGYAGGIAAENVNKNVILTQVSNKAEIVVNNGDYAGGIIARASENLLVEGAQNTATQTGKSVIQSGHTSRIEAQNYAGGIVGRGEDETEVNHYKVTETLGDVLKGDIISTKNSGEIYTAANYAGGIAGALTGKSFINYYNPEAGKTLPVINRGMVKANGSYAGGTAGAVAGAVKIRNVENLGGAITAEQNYAGGIIGAMGSEQEFSLGEETEARVDFYNEAVLAQDKSVAKTNYYTNTGAVKAVNGNWAGGIAGYVNTDTAVKNVFNYGAVEGQAYSGGIFGSVTARAKLEFDINLLKGRMTGAGKQAANIGTVKANKSFAGGIAGAVLSKDVVLYNAFNKGAVTALGDYAGGITGSIINQSADQILNYSLNQVILEIVLPSDSSDTFYTNSGSVKASNYAGGIVGYSLTKLDNVFNSGSVTASGSNAGGIAGELAGTSEELSLLYDDVVAGRILDKTLLGAGKNLYTNAGIIQAGTDNAGGIIGLGGKLVLQNVFNTGSVSTVSRDNAGGIAGSLSEESRIYLTTETASKAVAKKVTVNSAPVTAKRHNAGGIAGNVLKSTTIQNMFNSGLVQTGRDNAGGIAGIFGGGKIELADSVAKNSVNESFASNQGNVRSGSSNAGGVVGQISGTAQVTDVFNSGGVQAMSDNAGGVAGYLIDSAMIQHTSVLANDYVLPRHFMTNQGNVTAAGNNAGGIVGKAMGNQNDKPVLRDVYSGLDTLDALSVTAANNAGGIAGRLADVEITNEESVDKAISLKIYTNNSKITANNANAGGIIGNADNRTAPDNKFASYSTANMNGITTGAGLAKNTFQVGDVYNSGTILSKTNNAGGIIGVGGDGSYKNTTLRVVALTSQKMFTNIGAVTAARANAGGIIGFANEKFENTGDTIDYDGREVPVDIADVFNAGVVKAGYNAGGVAGKAVNLDLKYTKHVLTNAMKAETGNVNDFLFTNTNTVHSDSDNAGGVIGDANNSILQDIFNSGTNKSYDDAVTLDGENRITAAGSNAGGLVGRGKGLSITYSKLIANQIINNRAYVYTNIANVYAGSSRAGGIIGYGTGSVQLTDIYNMGKVEAHSGSSAGGIAGELYETGSDTVTDSGTAVDLSGINLDDNKVLKYGVDSESAEPVIGTAKKVSYITYRTITTSEHETTNRYSNRPKNKTIADLAADNIIAGADNAGGIVGYVNANHNTRSIRVENVFNSGAQNALGAGIAGIRAKGSNAGGLIGRSQNGYISYSFAINPGPNNRNTTEKGDHSTFAEAFNDLEVRKDPYAIELGMKHVGLHMVANNAPVRASSVNTGMAQTSSQMSVNFDTGRQNMPNENAGGAVGYMLGGRVERVYSLQGEIESPRNVGGVVGNVNNALVKQVSRLDGEDITLGSRMVELLGVMTTAPLARGSENVGGIVGLAASNSQILDTRNYIGVTGRTAVGGIVGRAGTGTLITLAQNAEPIHGKSLKAEEIESRTGTKLPYDDYRLDKSKVDGGYIGGIVGRGDNSVQVTMAKNDPLITDEFKELQLDDTFIEKYALGGNSDTMIDGTSYVGGITGAYGIVNYAVNTGKINGIKIIGGVSGSGYRITNSFNTADVIGENGYMYIHAAPTGLEGITEDQQATHIGGIAGELGERQNPDSIVQNNISAGTYIQSVFNGSQTVRGASYTGGIAGYAVGPIDVAYNSAAISAKQTGIVGGDPGMAGTKVGGLIGVMAQDRNKDIMLTNSYSVGEIVGTNDKGTLVGLLEGYTEEVLNFERIKNSYYLSDDEMNSWNSLTAQLASEINFGLKPLDVTDGSYLDTYIAKTDAITVDGNICAIGDTGQKEDSQYGLRNYTNMVRDYKVTGAGSGFTARGEANLQTPLNEGIDQLAGNTTLVDQVKASNANLSIQRKNTAKYVYPYENTKLSLGEDYEFPHLNFSGDIRNDSGTDEISLGDYSAELLYNNQAFSSLDNTKVSYYHNYWPTKVVNYLATSVEYDDGGNDDVSEYDKGKLVSPDDKTGMQITYRNNDQYPTQRITDEEIIFHGSYSRETESPDYIHFQVYDGHSRGRYSPGNEVFKNIVLPKSPVKVYTLAKASLFGVYEKPTKYKEVTIDNVLYYFYAKDTNNASGPDEYDSVDNLNVLVRAEAAQVEIDVELSCLEMNSYLPASSGYFTMEATKVYDEAAGIAPENFTTAERTSRMFSMHFSNTEIDETHNDSVLDQYVEFDYDDLDTLEYDSKDTAALGSTLLKESGSPGSYEINIENKLQVRNERHLYDMNHGETMGYADIGSSNLKYLMRDVELKNDIQLSVNPQGYNGFIIGASNDRLYRMTGSLDGNGYTIGNLRVNRLLNPGNFKELPYNDYAFIYDLSGGVVKDLYLGNDSKVIANTAAGLAYYVSNGRVPSSEDPYADSENMMYENLEPQLPKESGSDAKIYDTTVLAQISGQTVGGFSVYSGRRFNSSSDVPGGAAGSEEMKQAATYTNVTFGGKINGIYGSSDSFMRSGDSLAVSSLKAAGIQCYVSGNARTDDIDAAKPGLNIRSNYRTSVEINGSQVSEEGYVFANQISAGILGEALYSGQAEQVGTIRKSVNNGAVVSKQQANGITQGIVGIENERAGYDEECENLSHVDVTYSYNNGIVQTPEGTGLASGIGNYVSTASYCTNNGSVYGLIASGITNYGDKHTKVDLSANNGYVQGGQIAGGIVAAPSHFSGGKAKPNQYIQLKLSNSYNSGQVVVTTNIDNKYALENSYAGGILGYASSPKPEEYSWDADYVSDIEKEDMTIIDSCYNVGTVKYAKNYVNDSINSGVFSDNNRNIGGIAGGGLNRYVDIQNSYSLSDAELKEKEAAKPKKLNINASTTNFTKYEAQINVPADVTGYNYKLTAVGDVTYGDNVTTMNYDDMSVADNYVNFDDTIWTIDHDTKNSDGDILYPFPQFKERETQAAYVGDDHIADEPDFAYNVTFNEAKNGIAIETPAVRMAADDVTYKELVESDITYDDSKYSIGIEGYSESDDYQVTVFDGDAYAYTYAPTIIRQYQIKGGEVYSGGKLHDEKSTTETEMKFFDQGGVSLNGGRLTISDTEETGWYMPNHGFYSVVVTKSTLTEPSSGWFAKVGAFFTGDGTVHGNLKTEVRGKTSDRFQIHFGGTEANGSNIVSRGLIWDSGYKYGSITDPYHITDQYSIIGMTTSGIAKNATDKRYFKQVQDVTIDQPFYSMFEFNGDYNGDGHSITQENGEIGFISYLRSTDPAALTNTSLFAAQVHDLTLNITALESDQKMNELGKYQEASNYTANLGLIADYMEHASVNGITTGGLVQPKGFHKLANKKYYLDGAHTLAGISAVAKQSEISETQNRAQIGVKITGSSAAISLGPAANPGTMNVKYDIHNNVQIQSAGIAALVKDTKLDKVSNNGTIIASAGSRNAAGLVYTIDGAKSELTRSINGGQVKAHNGIAAGIVKQIKAGKIEQVYNSGKITAAFNIYDGTSAVVTGSGTAVGIVSDINGGSLSELYHAGLVTGSRQGAIARNFSDRGTLAGKAYYLKDDTLFWGDSHGLPNLPDSMNVNAEEAKQLEVLMGFGIVPSETWAFADNVRTDYVTTPADVLNNIPEVYEDPFAVTYGELTDQDEMQARGFDMTSGSGSGAWVIDASPANTTVNSSNAMIRDYAKDPYPLPKFVAYDHKTRANIDFPLFFGEAEQTAKTPYAGTDKKVHYEPYHSVTDAGKTETFKDTVKVDLNEMKSTSKYQVLVYDGDAQSSDLEEKENAIVVLSIVKKYIDPRSPGNAVVISNPANLQYSNIYSTDAGGAYYYEVLAIDTYGNEYPAIFANKQFVDDKNEILFNNNLLDRLPEPSNILKPYYSATVVHYQVPGKGSTDPLNFYAKFSPHFAEASVDQGQAWTYGTETNPYQISTQRNLYNISLGGLPRPEGGVPSDSHYLKSHYVQTQDIILANKKAAVDILREGPQENLWKQGIGTPGISFSGTYTGKSSNTLDPDGRYPAYQLVENRTGVINSIFNSISKDASVSDLVIALPAGNSYYRNPFLVKTSYGKIANITGTAKSSNAAVYVQTTTPYGLIAGETFGIPEATEAPVLKDITIDSRLTFRAQNSGIPSFGTVVGKINGFAKVENMQSAANLTMTGVNSRVVGGMIGEIGPLDGEYGPADLTIKDIKYSGAINADALSQSQSLGGIIGNVDKTNVTLIQTETTQVVNMSGTIAGNTYGGLIGKASNGDITVIDSKSAGAFGKYSSSSNTGSTIGGVIGKAEDVPHITLNNVISGTLDRSAITSVVSSNLIAGGIIGDAVTTDQTNTITFKDIVNNSSISMNGTTGTSILGGLIGRSDGYLVSMEAVKSLENISQSTNSTAAKAYLGGLIGQLSHAKHASLTSVEAGKYDTQSQTAQSSLITNGSGEMYAGGLIGNAETDFDSTDPSILMINRSNGNYNISMTNTSGKNVAGGLIGHSQGYQIAVDKGNALGSILQTVTNNTAMTFAGGVIGQAENAPEIKLTQMLTGAFDDENHKSLSSIQVTGNGRSRVYAGGVIGQADLIYDETAAITLSGVINNSEVAVTNPAGESAVSGIIGQQTRYEVTLDSVINRGEVKVEALGDESVLYAGGMIGKSVKGKLNLENISDNSNSSIVNYGDITVGTAVQRPENTSFVPGNLYASGGVGYSDHSITTIHGFHNTGNINVTGENQDMNLYLGGALAYAVSEESTEPMPMYEMTVSHTLNEGNLTDSRKVLSEEEQEDRTRTAGIAKAAGLVAETSTHRGVQVEYSQNTGVLKATTAAGIIHTVNGENSMKESSVKYNINMGFADVKETDNGDSITKTKELPVGEDASGIIFNGLGEIVYDPTDVYDEELIPVLTTYYNLTLEDTIRPEAWEEEAGETVPDKSLDSAAEFTLAEMQNYDRIIAGSGWTTEQIDQAENPVNDDSPWLIHSEDEALENEELPFLLPVIRTNEVVPKEDRAYLNKAIYDVVIETGVDGGYKVTWTYEDEIDPMKDGFAIIVDDEQGETRKIIELKPGIATDEGDGIYSYELTEGQLASVTNQLEQDELHKVRAAVMRGESQRRMSSLPADITLEKTDAVSSDSDSILVVVSPSLGLGGRSMFNLAYDGTIGSGVVAYAYTRMGDPYSMPLAGQGSYLDCSYLALESYRSVGINLPRTAAAQAQYMVENGYTISKDELQPGDLVFFSWGYNGRFMNIGHVAIYIGNGQVIEASSTQGEVVVGSLTADANQVLYGRPYASKAPTMNMGGSIGNGMNVPPASQEELYLVAQIVGLEAGGEGDEGMIAVAEVIKNRVLSGKFANTYTGVVSAPGQFSTYEMRNKYVPSQHQIELVKSVMEGKTGVLNNSGVLYFCAGWYYQNTGVNSSFWGGMKIVADYGNYFFAP